MPENYRYRFQLSNDLLNIGVAQTQQGVPHVSTALKLKIPDEYCCPISEDLFEDPVTTVDGQHYDRSAITRWFQIRRSSPCTGMPLANTTLSTDRRMVKNVREWVNGEDLVYSEHEQPPRKKSQLQKAQPVVITFQSRQGNFERTVSSDLALSALYKLAFRGLNGRYIDFNLSHADEVVLPANSSTISLFGITGNVRVNISLPGPILSTSGAAAVNSSARDDELCLVKIYNLSGELLFGVWFPKSTEVTFSYLLFKYCRFMWEEHSQFPKIMAPWTGLSDKGDGKSVGYTRSLLDEVAPYFTPAQAKGKLGNETLFESTPGYNFSEPLVFKFVFLTEVTNSSLKQNTQLSRLEALKQVSKFSVDALKKSECDKLLVMSRKLTARNLSISLFIRMF